MSDLKILTPDEMRQKFGVKARVDRALADKPVVREAIQEEVDAAMTKAMALKNTRRMTPAEIREGLDLLFQKYNFSPVEELIIIAQNTDNEVTQVSICKFLTEFMLPKLKTVEVKGQVDHNHTIVIRRFGPDGKKLDEPLRRVPGLPDPATGARLAVGSQARATEMAIDAEVVR